MPLISVVVPAYNAAEYLEQCLDSLSKQTFDDFEVLVIDDGSQDSTAAIAHNYVLIDDRFHLYRQPNGGVSKARNTGIDLARGKYITFVDADDALHPRALTAMYAALRDNDASVCISSFLKFQHEWQIDRFREPRNPGKSEVYSYEEAMKVALYQKRLLNSPWGMLMDKGFLGQSRRFSEDTRYEDLDAFYRFYEGAEKIVYLPFPYYFYRDNPQSFIHRWSDSRLDVLDVTDRLYEFMTQRYPCLKRGAADRRFSAHFNMLLLLLKYKVENREALSRCLRVIREGRKLALTDGNVRIKNKAGALLSYGGLGMLKAVSRLYSGR